MQTQLQADKKADEEMYDKLSCWCKVNGDGKGTAVEIATTKIADLNSRIKALTYVFSNFKSERMLFQLLIFALTFSNYWVFEKNQQFLFAKSQEI